MFPIDITDSNWGSSLFSLVRHLSVSVLLLTTHFCCDCWFDLTPITSKYRLGAANSHILSLPCFLITHTVWKPPRNLGEDHQTGHLIYNKVHLNSLLATSCTVLVAGIQYNSVLTVTLLSKKLNALWIRREILFCKPFVFLCIITYLEISFFLFSL